MSGAKSGTLIGKASQSQVQLYKVIKRQCNHAQMTATDKKRNNRIRTKLKEIKFLLGISWKMVFVQVKPVRVLFWAKGQRTLKPWALSQDPTDTPAEVFSLQRPPWFAAPPLPWGLHRPECFLEVAEHMEAKWWQARAMHRERMVQRLPAYGIQRVLDTARYIDGAPSENYGVEISWSRYESLAAFQNSAVCWRWC